MQFYDIPSKYEIPSDSKHITEEKAGEVYYSEPNRIVLFYKDTQNLCALKYPKCRGQENELNCIFQDCLLQ